MATWDDVRRVALALPEATERPGETAQWPRPAGPHRRADLTELVTEAWLARAPRALVTAFEPPPR